jgi:hypothetical protein
VWPRRAAPGESAAPTLPRLSRPTPGRCRHALARSPRGRDWGGGHGKPRRPAIGGRRPPRLAGHPCLRGSPAIHVRAARRGRRRRVLCRRRGPRGEEVVGGERSLEANTHPLLLRCCLPHLARRLRHHPLAWAVGGRQHLRVAEPPPEAPRSGRESSHWEEVGEGREERRGGDSSGAGVRRLWCQQPHGVEGVTVRKKK